MALFCDYSALITESDVEQKLIYPFLIADEPMGLGLDATQILTKKLLRGKAIGKGQSYKYYFPDYLINMRGIPIVVIEAKKPDEDLGKAYAEARLYAQEVNAGFPHKINVCQIAMVCNGTETWVGYTDQDEPYLKITFEEFSVENAKFMEVINFLSKNKLEKIANQPYEKARGKAEYFTPVSKLGGKRVQNAELEENTFGRTFILENKTIFDPKSEQDMALIVENAYISSTKREQHIEPIYKEIKKFEIPNIKNTTLLSTNEPIELIQKMSQCIEEKNDAYSLMLLVGNVGSGKTTFIRYFKKMFLESTYPDLAKQCDWIFLNMNNAPISSNEIYDWIKLNIIEVLKSNHPDIAFSEMETIKKIFRKEIKDFEVGIGSLLKNDEKEYNRELYNILKTLMEDKNNYLNALLIYLKESRRTLPIIVLDNCDKRNKDEQLLMFQVAEWIRTLFKCIVILPMRDSTYDMYRNEPPLDTVVKDLVFRIDPPDLLKVIQARLDYIVRITNQTDTTFILKNGMNVSMQKRELIEYFKCILLAIRNNRGAADIFYRLSDKNTRNGIQLFEDFCKSGHILADDILNIRALGREYELPLYKFLNALLRKNRKYYNGEESNFVNLFYSDFHDDMPDPFVRIDILYWLKNKIVQEGPAGIKGMFPASELFRELQLFGHELHVLERELNYLIKKGLILSETLSNSAEKDDLVKIALPGSLHLRLLKNVAYLAACAEDVLFKDVTVMTAITQRLKSNTYTSKTSMALTANDLVQYLLEYKKEFCAYPEQYICEDSNIKIFDLNECKRIIEKWIEDDSVVKEGVAHIDFYKPGTVIDVSVEYKSNGSLICRFGMNKTIKGFISACDKRYELNYSEYEKILEGDSLRCEILEFNYTHDSFQLKFLQKIESFDYNQIDYW